MCCKVVAYSRGKLALACDEIVGSVTGMLLRVAALMLAGSCVNESELQARDHRAKGVHENGPVKQSNSAVRRNGRAGDGLDAL